MSYYNEKNHISKKDSSLIYKYSKYAKNALDENEIYNIIINNNYIEEKIINEIKEKARIIEEKGDDYGWKEVKKGKLEEVRYNNRNKSKGYKGKKNYNRNNYNNSNLKEVNDKKNNKNEHKNYRNYNSNDFYHYVSKQPKRPFQECIEVPSDYNPNLIKGNINITPGENNEEKKIGNTPEKNNKKDIQKVTPIPESKNINFNEENKEIKNNNNNNNEEKKQIENLNEGKKENNEEKKEKKINGNENINEEKKIDDNINEEKKLIENINEEKKIVDYIDEEKKQNNNEINKQINNDEKKLIENKKEEKKQIENINKEIKDNNKDNNNENNINKNIIIQTNKINRKNNNEYEIINEEKKEESEIEKENEFESRNNTQFDQLSLSEDSLKEDIKNTEKEEIDEEREWREINLRVYLDKLKNYSMTVEKSKKNNLSNKDYTQGNLYENKRYEKNNLTIQSNNLNIQSSNVFIPAKYNTPFRDNLLKIINERKKKMCKNNKNEYEILYPMMPFFSQYYNQFNPFNLELNEKNN